MPVGWRILHRRPLLLLTKRRQVPNEAVSFRAHVPRNTDVAALAFAVEERVSKHLLVAGALALPFVMMCAMMQYRKECCAVRSVQCAHTSAIQLGK